MADRGSTMNQEEAPPTKLYREPSNVVDDLAHKVIGAAIEVHRELGPGYLESIYQVALEAELRMQGLPFQSQVPLGVFYKGLSLGTFRLDLVVDDQLVVELKTVDAIGGVHIAQLISYLKVTGHPLGLILNFKVPILKQGIRRVLPPYR